MAQNGTGNPVVLGLFDHLPSGYLLHSYGIDGPFNYYDGFMMIYLWNILILHSYVTLPEANSCFIPPSAKISQHQGNIHVSGAVILQSAVGRCCLHLQCPIGHVPFVLFSFVPANIGTYVSSQVWCKLNHKTWSSWISMSISYSFLWAQFWLKELANSQVMDVTRPPRRPRFGCVWNYGPIPLDGPHFPHVSHWRG